jgi:hypothetical protein
MERIRDRTTFFRHSKWYIRIDMLFIRTMHILRGAYSDDDQLTYLSSSFSMKNCFHPDEIILDVLYLLQQSIVQRSNININIRAYLLEYCSRINQIPRATLNTAQCLSCQQLAGLFVFLQFRSLQAMEISSFKHKIQGPNFSLDPCSVFIWCMVTDDIWKIKQLLGPLLMAKSRRGKRSHDHSLVSLDFVKSNRCYGRVLEMISQDGTRVLMTQPGEITFVPVKHCRWCGLIKVEKFRLCSLCIEFPEYLDVNYFCSEKCETEALDSKHREEHARYYLAILGMEK